MIYILNRRIKITHRLCIWDKYISCNKLSLVSISNQVKLCINEAIITQTYPYMNRRHDSKYYKILSL